MGGFRKGTPATTRDHCIPDSTGGLTSALVVSLAGAFGNGCVSGSLSDEQKGQLLRRFKVLCLTGLHSEGKQTNGKDQSTLIRCNCCYNLPV